MLGNTSLVLSHAEQQQAHLCSSFSAAPAQCLRANRANIPIPTASNDVSDTEAQLDASTPIYAAPCATIAR